MESITQITYLIREPELTFAKPTCCCFAFFFEKMSAYLFIYFHFRTTRKWINNFCTFFFRLVVNGCHDKTSLVH